MKHGLPVPVILRADDIHGATSPTELALIYGPCWENGIPVCLSVIPKSVFHFGQSSPGPDMPVDIRDNTELIRFLAELAIAARRHHRNSRGVQAGYRIEGKISRGFGAFDARKGSALTRVQYHDSERRGKR